MSRRAAMLTQADASRAMKAARQVGPDWQVLIEGKVIRLERGETPSTNQAIVEPKGPLKVEPEQKWEF